MVEDEQPGDVLSKWPNHKWDYLIVAREECIVYIDDECDIDWQTSAKYDSTEEANPKFDLRSKIDIFNDGALLEVTPCEELELSKRKHFKRLIGEAYVCCFAFDYDGARAMLLEAKHYIRARSEEISRKWYLTACGGAALPFLAGTILFWLLRLSLKYSIGDTAYWVCLSVLIGGLGALLSVITRAGRLRIDCAAGHKLHRLEGCSRIIAGGISGGVAALAIKSGILLSILAHSADLHAGLMLVALSAGYAERLAPSIIAKFELPPSLGPTSPDN